MRCPVRTPWTRSTTSSEPASNVIWPAAPTCRAEVASLREASAVLADDGDHAPPAGLRDAVLSGITRVRPLPPVTVGGPVHRRRWFPALVAAVVLALVGVGGAVWQPWRDDTSSRR